MARVPTRRRLLAVLASAMLFAAAVVGSVSAASAPTLALSGLPSVIPVGWSGTFNVLVTDGANTTLTSDCASGGLVHVSVVGTDYSGSAAASAGVASFTAASVGLNILTVGTYVVSAYEDSVPGCNTVVGATQASIQVVAAGTTCPPAQACTTPPIQSPGGSVATITAGPGVTITAAFVRWDPSLFTACAGESNHDPNYALAFNVTGSSLPKLIKDVLPGAGPARMCWNSATDFIQRGGGFAPADPAGGFTGLLPDCVRAHPTLPCVLAVLPNPRTNTTTVWIVAPSGDPQVKG